MLRLSWPAESSGEAMSVIDEAFGIDGRMVPAQATQMVVHAPKPTAHTGDLQKQSADSDGIFFASEEVY